MFCCDDSLPNNSSSALMNAEKRPTETMFLGEEKGSWKCLHFSNNQDRKFYNKAAKQCNIQIEQQWSNNMENEMWIENDVYGGQTQTAFLINLLHNTSLIRCCLESRIGKFLLYIYSIYYNNCNHFFLYCPCTQFW